jgi:hypothetical protein
MLIHRLLKRPHFNRSTRPGHGSGRLLNYRIPIGRHVLNHRTVLIVRGRVAEFADAQEAGRRAATGRSALRVDVIRMNLSVYQIKFA